MSSIPSVLEDAWNKVQPSLTGIRDALSSQESPHPRIIRVGQLDSELLDQELAHLLQEPVTKALSFINAAFKARFEAELHLLIQLTLYKLSVWNTGATYGAKLQDLKYVVSGSSSKHTSSSGLPRNTLVLHGALTVVVPYLHNRFRSHALSNAWPDAPSSDRRRKIWDSLNFTESVYALLGLANFVAFLWSGRYRTLVDRLLRMSLVPSRRLVKRDVSYEFMNRQMVWHAFTEFLLFLLPLISARTIRHRFYRLASLLSPTALYPFLPFKALLGHQVTTGSQRKRGKSWSLPEDQCAICVENANFNVSDPSNLFTTLGADSSSTDATLALDPPAYPIYNPYQTSCGHIYCYHCVAERIIRNADYVEGEAGWECLRCGEKVQEAHRFTAEIIESERSESDYEFSSDLDIGTDLSGSMGSYSESGFSE
ncbi:hypothetical protein M413DRAFT_301650 [Hebeloma cylindrosporum]|uniref:RING-type E3 ubiquitin transferase (cysteine targeting) n=1 Tax=Hebeloma cylindrosporum TaxID=76867 RepID=A0A0C3CQA1_HEBCY|nr:hypothetical protein M413DRAFT_301650 [Hebeloma cylindrosporum h7]